MFEVLKLEDILAVQYVDRWHMVETKRKQNIAEHSYMVTLIAGKLGPYLKDPLTTQERVDLYEGCLLHDTPELKWGDMPTPTKKFFISQGLGWVLELMEIKFWAERGGHRAPLSLATPKVKNLVRLADLVEAYIFYRKEGVDTSIQHRLYSDAWEHFNECFGDEDDMSGILAAFMAR